MALPGPGHGWGWSRRCRDSSWEVESGGSARRQPWRRVGGGALLATGYIDISATWPPTCAPRCASACGRWRSPIATADVSASPLPPRRPGVAKVEESATAGDVMAPADGAATSGRLGGGRERLDAGQRGRGLLALMRLRRCEVTMMEPASVSRSTRHLTVGRWARHLPSGPRCRPRFGSMTPGAAGGALRAARPAHGRASTPAGPPSTRPSTSATCAACCPRTCCAACWWSPGYEVTYVTNITDVGHLTDDGDEGDDKIEAAAATHRPDRRRDRRAATRSSGPPTGDSWAASSPTTCPRAGDHVAEQIEHDPHARGAGPHLRHRRRRLLRHRHASPPTPTSPA